MKYGFIIDNRKCIGCHACTVACKSEHDVPLGVNRTWVKQIEKGEFPNTKRLFSVLRCNQCSDAPCVEICPVEALFNRDDGIVDFNSDRCIGCKACMQACPYDALYIDPESHTAAKCNYCAHRVDIGLEPACVNVCPEHAIISGDMENPESEISQLLAREQVTVRKPEKGTQPNVFYIDGDQASLNPTATEKSENYYCSTQSHGVGHFAKYAEKLSEGKDILDMARELRGEKLHQREVSFETGQNGKPKKSIEVLMDKALARRVYDTPDKGILWGWEVSAYILTKAIAAGTVLIAFLASVLNLGQATDSFFLTSILTALIFLTITGGLLVKDLDKPARFAYILLRPQWNSWLVKGGYAITFYGGFLTLYLVAHQLNWQLIKELSLWGSAILAIIVAIYTAFLFAQAKGRDFWQSPLLPFHMLVHSLMAGASTILIISLVLDQEIAWIDLLEGALSAVVIGNMLILLFEMTITHPTSDAKITVSMILTGRYSLKFWLIAVTIGNILPLIFLIIGFDYSGPIAGLMILIGIYYTEQIWIEAPQRIPLA